MIEKADLILYGGVGIASVLIVLIAYRVYKKRGEVKPENHVMNKIQDFYSIQDNPNNPDINY